MKNLKLIEGKEHTFSCWIRSDAAGSIEADGKSINTDSTWARFEVTFIAESGELQLNFSPGTYYIYHPMLEFGTQTSDWSPSPEDVDEEIGRAKLSITAITEFVNSAQSGEKTVINGGAIETDSVKARAIDIEELFTQYIEAINLLIKGKSAFEDKITIKSTALNANAEITIEEKVYSKSFAILDETGELIWSSNARLIPFLVIQSTYGLYLTEVLKCIELAANNLHTGYITTTGGMTSYGPAEFLKEVTMHKALTLNSDLTLKGKLNLHPVGSVVTMETNTNPGAFLGGTWELFDKGFKRENFNSDNISGMIALGENASNATVRAIVDGHKLDIRCTGSFSVDLAETNRTLCTLNYKKIGITNLPFDAYGVGGGDDANAMVFGYIGYNSGNVVITDVNPKTDGATIESGQKININFSSNIAMRNMDDAFCDKFYFKRIS